ncbi:MAG: DUF3047 domain-containing protein [Pseudomonadota bacterium]|nr:DUF3047 domain-containing protein [Pseudomonadota bacterium]
MARRAGDGRTAYLALCIVLAVAPTTSSASDGNWSIDDADLVPDVFAAAGWRLLFRTDVAPTRFRPQGDGVIAIETEDSVGFLFRGIREQERNASHLVWRWTVLESLPPADLSRPGADDRPAAVHLWFSRSARTRDLWDRLKDGIAEFAGLPLAGKTLTYVWGGAHRRGERFPSPYETEDGAVVVLRPGDTRLREWHWEKVDFAADFELAFGYPAPPVRYVAVSADSEDAGGSSTALVADLRFETAGI